MIPLQKASIIELRNLETELRLRVLNGTIPEPPGVNEAETPEERQHAWEQFVLVVYYQRQLGRSKI